MTTLAQGALRCVDPPNHHVIGEIIMVRRADPLQVFLTHLLHRDPDEQERKVSLPTLRHLTRRFWPSEPATALSLQSLPAFVLNVPRDTMRRQCLTCLFAQPRWQQGTEAV
ncbi:hypothetical protein [uncultured Roseobacter sp.]|uniref:hypothetical protein n=1 Tax=uncultured Roseobacter sp. TaxID=114847 RepID=UPI00261E7F1C|nr:hypothetical protein [uncultured Roseobacter sp.]